MLLLFGDDLLEGPDQENVSDSNSEQHRATFTGGTSLTSIIQGLVELMDDEVNSIRKYMTKTFIYIFLESRYISSCS